MTDEVLDKYFKKIRQKRAAEKRAAEAKAWKLRYEYELLEKQIDSYNPRKRKHIDSIAIAQERMREIEHELEKLDVDIQFKTGMHKSFKEKVSAWWERTKRSASKTKKKIGKFFEKHTTQIIQGAVATFGLVLFGLSLFR
jgi:Na+-translocating ferredoxin:NAD+ oxidoreductase RnfC subunit